MIELQKSLKVIAQFLAGLILLQSCSSYKTPITLQQAAQEEKAVKIVTVDDETYKYKYIVYQDGQFYGVKDNPGEDVKFPIETEEVTAVIMQKDRGVFLKWGIIGVIVVFLISIPIFLLTY